MHPAEATLHPACLQNQREPRLDNIAPRLGHIAPRLGHIPPRLTAEDDDDDEDEDWR